MDSKKTSNAQSTTKTETAPRPIDLTEVVATDLLTVEEVEKIDPTEVEVEKIDLTEEEVDTIAKTK
jgi:hypothetical protein